MDPVKTVEWVSRADKGLVPGFVKMIDQTLLPNELKFLEIDDVQVLWEAIKVLRVRGAPAIGVAAAMGVVIAVQNSSVQDSGELCRGVIEAADYLATSRPTAVNLFWALDRMKRVASENSGLDVSDLKERLAREAVDICEEDTRMCHDIGRHGSDLLESGCTVLTHCNAGSLATSCYGTALSPVYVAAEQGKDVKVFADETRPLLQGARLTAWELQQAGVDVTVICDNMAAQVMREGRVDIVFVGADRIAGNGDAANKIGTYGLAVLAKHHGVPFYVLAPTSTFDVSLSKGDEIPIEQRAAEEITNGFGRRTVPEGVKVYSPAFDVTPAELIHGIVCEKGVARPPYGESLSAFLSQS